MNEREKAIMMEAFMIGRIYATNGEKESPAEIQEKLERKCRLFADAQQRSETRPHEMIVMLRNSLKDEIKRVSDIVDDTKSEDRDNIYYRGIEVGLNKALSLLEMHKAT